MTQCLPLINLLEQQKEVERVRGSRMCGMKQRKLKRLTESRINNEVVEDNNENK